MKPLVVVTDHAHRWRPVNYGRAVAKANKLKKQLDELNKTIVPYMRQFNCAPTVIDQKVCFSRLGHHLFYHSGIKVLTRFRYGQGVVNKFSESFQTVSVLPDGSFTQAACKWVRDLDHEIATNMAECDQISMEFQKIRDFVKYYGVPIKISGNQFSFDGPYAIRIIP